MVTAHRVPPGPLYCKPLHDNFGLGVSGEGRGIGIRVRQHDKIGRNRQGGVVTTKSCLFIRVATGTHAGCHDLAVTRASTERLLYSK